MASKAVEVYDIIDQKAGSNMFLQGLSGAFGFPFTAVADVGVFFTHYGPMLNKIREVYGLENADTSSLRKIVMGCKNELIADLVIDKVIGNIPVVGLPANILCAKAMTWRLGILFGMLSARGEEINPQNVDHAVQMIRKVFPQSSSLLFRKPSAKIVEKLLTTLEDVTKERFDDIILKVLDAACEAV